MRSPLLPPRPGLGPCSEVWGERGCPHLPPPCSSGLRRGGRAEGRRKGERKGGKFQEPGLEANKESVFLPFHQQTSTQKEVLKNPKPTHTGRETVGTRWRGDVEAGARRPSGSGMCARPGRPWV